MKRLFIVSGLILVALLFAACVNGETVNGQTAEATFVVH
jgi:predicted small secreted protein